MQESKSNKKGLIIGIIVLVILIAAAAVAYMALKPGTQSGSKNVTLTVVDKDGGETTYTVKTDAEYLKDVMDTADGLTYEGASDGTGYMVNTVNGETADYNVDGAYWAFYINGKYCKYGITQQPVADGDAFRIEYTKG